MIAVIRADQVRPGDILIEQRGAVIKYVTKSDGMVTLSDLPDGLWPDGKGAGWTYNADHPLRINTA